jgi:hypothetical protein
VTKSRFPVFSFLFLIFFVFGGTELGPLYTRSQGQGSTQINQAFLLMQKLKLAPRDYKLGVKAKVQLKPSIPIGANVEISPNGLYTRSQGQSSTQIKHSYWCKSWNQPQGALH